MKIPKLAACVFVAAAAAASPHFAHAQEPVSAAAGPVVPPKTYYDAVEVTVAGKPEAAGVVVIVFQTIGGEPRPANVNVILKMGEDDIAQDVAKELTVLAGNAFKVKTKSGNRIVISKAAKNSPNLNISLGMQTVPGIAVSFRKD